ncbi:transcriptional regulator, LytTR family [Muriicola jejuensis]|uniref:LytTR family transcriptional regulator n=1 Tax=Muriicola jejuensis TaxID=504488 RepID=A0A6P0UIS1_9FLAO|nr:LytTR family DNA-binding domain-containing protein [Muriicola jejuensis]NER10096.1 LytTR family transcriptional regulator [Muriicola jejuensis]SMP02932.1 transcriptional regulator, LytTR family [Muriicola jejuensis]
MAVFPSIKKFLQTPYPFYFRGRSLLYFGLIIFFLALFFNYFFIPFNVNSAEHKMDYFWICVLHSLMPLAILLLMYPYIHFSPTLDEHWNIGRELVFLCAFLLLIGIGQFLIRDLIFDNPNNWSWGYLREEVSNTFLVGILLVGLIVSVNFNRLNARYIRDAQELERSRLLEARKKDKSVIPIETQVKMDNFDLEVEKFIFAKAEGNYLTIHLNKEGQPVKMLKRISISDFEQQAQAIDNIIRTHRSYVVNLSFLRHVKGNAQGFQLSLEHCAQEIPVSRNMIPAFESRLRGS